MLPLPNSKVTFAQQQPCLCAAVNKIACNKQRTIDKRCRERPHYKAIPCMYSCGLWLTLKIVRSVSQYQPCKQVVTHRGGRWQIKKLKHIYMYKQLNIHPNGLFERKNPIGIWLSDEPFISPRKVARRLCADFSLFSLV